MRFWNRKPLAPLRRVKTGIPGIYTGASGKFEATFRDENGKQKFVTCETLAEAEALRAVAGARGTSEAIRKLEHRLDELRQRRDAHAVALIDAGMTWREVGALCGFSNSYIAHLKRVRKDVAA